VSCFCCGCHFKLYHQTLSHNYCNCAFIHQSGRKWCPLLAVQLYTLETIISILLFLHQTQNLKPCN